MSYFFEGWYYKHQNETNTISFIPGFTHNKAFIQMVTNEKSCYFPFELSECSKGRTIRIGKNFFSPKGISINIKQGGYDIKGKIKYDNLTPIKSDIMGPFRFFPMQCRHGIISLYHRLNGSIYLNDREICLNNGLGYIETDSGRSFPKSYAWLQSNDFNKKCSIMIAIADIPFLGTHFRGVICAVMYKGIQYRLATYNGAKIIRCSKNEIIIKRGPYRLEARIESNSGHSLAAPHLGQMSRMIKENPSCNARFKFYFNNCEIFDMKSKKTSFEYVE